jgi:hypothetical protein
MLFEKVVVAVEPDRVVSSSAATVSKWVGRVCVV